MNELSPYIYYYIVNLKDMVLIIKYKGDRVAFSYLFLLILFDLTTVKSLYYINLNSINLL